MSASQPATMCHPRVAAVLSSTSIPAFKSKPHQRSRLSEIDKMARGELVEAWKRDMLTDTKPTRHYSMDMLLLDPSRKHETNIPLSRAQIATDTLSSSFNSGVSWSTDSTPGLDHDDKSEVSWGSPSTVSSSHDHSAQYNLATEQRSVRPKAMQQICSLISAYDHPLNDAYDGEQEEVPLDIAISLPSATLVESRSLLPTRLTSSLQTLRARALSSLQSFTLHNAFAFSADYSANAIDDDHNMLWSHSYLFPRLSSEIRPEAFDETPCASQRHYFNPPAQNLDQQRSSYREALHAHAGEAIEHVSMIPLKVYSSSVTANVEHEVRVSADAQDKKDMMTVPQAAPAIHHREPRENNDFLRVAVLELNMRRAGKLDARAQGRARIWLPPREMPKDPRPTAQTCCRRGVPHRWRGVTAKY